MVIIVRRILLFSIAGVAKVVSYSAKIKNECFESSQSGPGGVLASCARRANGCIAGGNGGYFNSA